MLTDAGELTRDFLRRQDDVDAAAAHGALRHPRVLRRFFVLREGDAAGRLDVFDPQRAVRAGAGQDDADRGGLPIFGERLEEGIDG